jgi:hypothetical protein
VKPNIVKAVQDGNLFRSYVTGAEDGSLASWRHWLTFLRALYGLPIPNADEGTVKLCTGRDPAKLSRDGYSECLLLCGRRSGKSKTIALVGAAEAVLSGKEKALSAGEIPMVAILSPTRFQSRIIFSYLKGVFDSSPILQNEVAEEKKEGFKLTNGVEVAIITGSPQSCRGFSVIAAITDEIAMFGLSEESHVRSDTELVRALRPSLASTGGRLLCVGTPYAAKGYAYLTWKRAYGNDTCDVLCWNAASTLMNPTLSAKVVQRAIDEDPIAANVEYCTAPGLFREDVDNFITRAAVEALVIRGRQELPPRQGIHYAAFADVSGGRHDDACLAIAHKEDRVIVLDCLERYKAPHNPYEVVSEMCDTIRRYGCDRAMGDAYAAEWTRVAFGNHGINYRRASTSVWKEGTEAKNRIAKPKSILYSELLPRLHSGEVELLDNETLIAQLCSLQRRTRSGARDSIDHPPGGHDDCANVLAGVVDSASQRRMVAGSGDEPTGHFSDQQLSDIALAKAIGSMSGEPPFDPFARFREAALQDFHERVELHNLERSQPKNVPEGWLPQMRVWGRVDPNRPGR